MKITDIEKKRISELRKIERQAKALIYKMQKLESEWKKLREEVKTTSLSVPKTLGDAISRWHKI